MTLPFTFTDEDGYRLVINANRFPEAPAAFVHTDLGSAKVTAKDLPAVVAALYEAAGVERPS
jgi:hypothetical protein